MRFYNIIIKQNGTLWIPPSMQGFLTDASYSSLMPGSTTKANPSALDVYIDIPAYYMSSPLGGAHVVLSGISLEDISQFNRLTDATIEVHAGMLDGYLPLAKNFKPDLLTRGIIYQTAGNWEGTNTTLELLITTAPALNPSAQNKALTFNWAVGTQLKAALQQVLDASYGKSASNPNGFNISIAISPDLVARSTFPGTYANLTAFGTALKLFTRNGYPGIQRLDGSQYGGVEIYIINNTIYCDDGTQPGQATAAHPKDKPLVIGFTDLIGQPVWKTANQLVFKTVMRGDIALRDYVNLPAALSTPFVISSTGVPQQAPNTTLGMGSPSKNKLGFTGDFQVQEVRHIGQFRQATGQGWVTVVDAFVPFKQATPVLTSEPAATNRSGAVQSTEPPPGTINPTNPFNTPPPPTPPPPPSFPPLPGPLPFGQPGAGGLPIPPRPP